MEFLSDSNGVYELLPVLTLLLPAALYLSDSDLVTNLCLSSTFPFPTSCGFNQLLCILNLQSPVSASGSYPESCLYELAMTDPADSDQLHTAVSSQGATIGRHKELLRGLMEGFQTLAERHDHALNTLLEQFP